MNILGIPIFKTEIIIDIVLVFFIIIILLKTVKCIFVKYVKKTFHYTTPYHACNLDYLYETKCVAEVIFKKFFGHSVLI